MASAKPFIIPPEVFFGPQLAQKSGIFRWAQIMPFAKTLLTQIPMNGAPSPLFGNLSLTCALISLDFKDLGLCLGGAWGTRRWGGGAKKGRASSQSCHVGPWLETWSSPTLGLFGNLRDIGNKDIDMKTAGELQKKLQSASLNSVHASLWFNQEENICSSGLMGSLRDPGLWDPCSSVRMVGVFF